MDQLKTTKDHHYQQLAKKDVLFFMFVTLDTSHLLMSALNERLPEKAHFRFVTNFVFQFSIVPYFATTFILLWSPAIQSSISFPKPVLGSGVRSGGGQAICCSIVNGLYFG